MHAYGLCPKVVESMMFLKPFTDNAFLASVVIESHMIGALAAKENFRESLCGLM